MATQPRAQISEKLTQTEDVGRDYAAYRVETEESDLLRAFFERTNPKPAPGAPAASATPGGADAGVADPGALQGQPPIDMSRPIITNQEGTFSTEKNIGIEVEGKHYNIPTIIDGKEVSADEAVAHFEQTGEHHGVFDTEEEATAAAIARSAAIGQARGTDEAAPGDLANIIMKRDRDVGVIERALDVAADVGAGLVEAPRQVFGGVVDAVQSTLDAAHSLSDYLNEKGIESGYGLQPITLPEWVIPDEPDTTTGSVVRSVSQFLAGFFPAARALRAAGAAGKVTNPAMAGALADMIAMPTDEGRLADMLVKSESPVFNNAVTQFLASDPNDTEAVARVKNALEGLALGSMFDVTIRALRFAREAQLARREVRAAQEPTGQQAIEAAAARLESTRAEISGEDLASKLRGSERPEGFLIVPMADIADVRQIGDRTVYTGNPRPWTSGELSDEDILVRVRSAQGRAEITETRALEAATGGIQPPDRIYLNLNRINEPEDIQQALKAMADIDAPGINVARGGEVQSLDAVQDLANDMDMTVEDLLKRRRGQPMAGPQALAARRLLNASGERLVELAHKAGGVDASDLDIYAFRKAQSIHYAIQSEVIDARTATARALNAWNIPAKAGPKERGQLVSELLENAFGPQAKGKPRLDGREGSIQMARMISAIGTPEGINRFARESAGARTRDAIFEAWINGLLSSPKTHIVNMLSNALVSGYAIPERLLAEQFSRELYGGEVAKGEAAAMAFGWIQGSREGIRVAWKAMRTGEPSDLLTKIEGQQQHHISAEALGKSGLVGHTWDLVGSVIRSPGRALMTADEYWKAVAYRMQINALALRQATGEGLEGDDLARRITEILDNPSEEIRLASSDFARIQTFTNPLGEIGQAASSAINRIPGLRYIIPFKRTPANIMKYAFQRTPLAPFIGQVRAAIQAGARPGATAAERAAAAEAYAKVGLGTTMMLVAADLTNSGMLVGAGPADPKLRAARLRQNIKPYSIKIGDRWYVYSRTDPLGLMLGMAADVGEIIGQVGEEDGDKIALAGAMAFAKNMANKTYMRSFFEAINVLDDPDRYALEWVAKMAGTLIPFSSLIRNVEEMVDPVRRETKTAPGDPLAADIAEFTGEPLALFATRLVNEVRSRTPGFSDSLEPKRNLWGEPIDASSGLGKVFDFLSPVYSSLHKPNIVDQAIEANKTSISMPSRSIFRVPLTDDEYSRYVQLAGEPALPALKNLIGRASFKRLSPGRDGAQSTAIKTVISKYRQAAQAKMLIEFPELRARVIEKRQEMARSMTGQEAPSQ